jgi:uncharacterized Fe-S cluster-containing radical SAM superfamily protein
MPPAASDLADARIPEPLPPEKFRDPGRTLDGSPRARVRLSRLETLWVNTGTLCNLTCTHCYMESSPTNDRLAYITAAEVSGYLDEIGARGLATRTVAFTGGEPFMNPDFLAMLEDALGRGLEVLVLTNAMRPMQRLKAPLLALHERFGARLRLRVSVDHYAETLHRLERGARSWQPTIDGLVWLAESGFEVSVAGRTLWQESEAQLRDGYGRLFARLGVALDVGDPARLVLFPEMDETLDVPEITEACWGILGVNPDAMMCATSRMVVKRKGADRPVVMPCTLIPYDDRFEMGHSLAEAEGAVPLNHPHCARFCVLGGASCSGPSDVA